MNRKTYDLKEAKKFWADVITRKIIKNEAEKLYNELVQKVTDILEK